MLKRIIKPLAIVSAAALMISVSAVSLAAGSGKGSERNSANTQTCQGKNGSSHAGLQGTGNGNKSAESQTSNGLQCNSNKMKSRPENASSCGMNCKSVTEAIASLSEDDAATLSEYIADYEAAVAAFEAAKEDAEEGEDLSAYTKTVRTSLLALLDAAKDAEIELSPEFGNQFNKADKQDNGMHFGAISNAIAALSEVDAATLSEYITNYENAVTAMKNPSADDEDNEDLSSYREAVQTALKALLAAAEDKGIELTPTFEGQGCKMDGKRDQHMNCLEILAAIDDLSEDDAATLSEYITNYEDAVDALTAAKEVADEDAEEDEDLSSYREAVQTALQALLDAAEDEGIDLFPAPVVE